MDNKRVAFWGILCLVSLIAIISNSQINGNITGFAVLITGNSLYLIGASLTLMCLILGIFIIVLIRRLRIRLAEEKIISWVYDAKKKGFPDEKIEEMLKANNWSHETIMTILRYVDDRTYSAKNINEFNTI